MSELPVTHTDEPELPVEIDKKALIKQAKAAEEKEIIRIRQQFNTRTMRVKTKLLSDAGVQIRDWGVKEVGHGRLHYGAENADRAVEAIQRDIDRLVAEDPKGNANVIAELRATQLRFNKQIIEVGKLHLDAAKEVASKGGSSDMRIAFPAGQQIVVAVAPKSPPVNDTEKTLTEGGGGP